MQSEPKRSLLDCAFVRTDDILKTLELLTGGVAGKVEKMLANDRAYLVEIKLQKHPTGTFEIHASSYTDYELTT